MTKYIDNLTVEGLATLSAKVLVPTSTATTAAGTLTLTATASCAQYLTGTAAGFSVVLPSALTLATGQRYEIFNTSSQAVTVKDGSGATLLTLSSASIAYIYLQTNGTAAGGWISWQVLTSTVASGILNYNVVASTTFVTASATDVQITGFSVTPIAGTYAATFSANGLLTGSGIDVTSSIYLGSTAVADSPRTVASGAGSHKVTMSSQTTAQWDGVKTASVYVNTTGSLTVTGRSLSLIRLGP